LALDFNVLTKHDAKFEWKLKLTTKAEHWFLLFLLKKDC